MRSGLALVLVIGATFVVGISGRPPSGVGDAQADYASLARGSVVETQRRARPTPRQCHATKRAVTFYSSRIAYWLDRKGTRRRASRVRSSACPRYLARVLRFKAYATRRHVAEWLEHHWNWRSWLPANWLAVAICESGHNPPNWAHDSGTYVSAFGIFRPGYVDDAHRIGALSWDETKRKLGRLPTPREQYDAALSHYRTHGDGWGCQGP